MRYPYPGNLPVFRRLAIGNNVGCYIEGWALYAESLGDDLDAYKDPYERFGRLSFSMLRAVRLVADTGINAMRWTREQARTYMADNLVAPKQEIEVELDRYICEPAQALSYKIGELEIRRLRKLAEEQLANDFDVRDFHEVVLDGGALPMDLLEDKVKSWISARPWSSSRQGRV